MSNNFLTQYLNCDIFFLNKIKKNKIIKFATIFSVFLMNSRAVEMPENTTEMMSRVWVQNIDGTLCIGNGRKDVVLDGQGNVISNTLEEYVKEKSSKSQNDNTRNQKAIFHQEITLPNAHFFRFDNVITKEDLDFLETQRKRESLIVCSTWGENVFMQGTISHCF